MAEKIVVKNDGHEYGTHKEALASLGINFRSSVHHEGAYALFGDWSIWFPNMTGNGGDWQNRFVSGESVIEETYLADGEPNDDWTLLTSNTRLIVFAKIANKYVFKGVYGVKQATARMRQYHKLAESCELHFEGVLP